MAPLSNDNNLTATMLLSYLRYDAQTGHLRWVGRRGRGITGAIAGTEARNGYVRVKLLGRDYSAHRLAWLAHYGEWPEENVDHINGNKADNRIENLRLATVAQNAWNMKPGRRGISPFRGVSFIRHLGKWRAQITANKITHTAGYFRDEEEAARAYDKLAADLYGDFARLNFPTNALSLEPSHVK